MSMPASWTWHGATNATASPVEPLNDETRQKFTELLAFRAIREMARAGMTLVVDFVVVYETMYYDRLCETVWQCIAAACKQAPGGIATQEDVKKLLENIKSR